MAGVFAWRAGSPPRRVDVLLAGAVFAVGQSQVLGGWSDGGVGSSPHGQQLARALLVAGFTVPLAWRRRYPLGGIAAVCAAIVAQLLLVAAYVPLLAGLLPMAVGNYTAAAYAPRWRFASLPIVFAAEAVIYARIPQERAAGEVLFAVFVLLGTWIVGDVVRQRLLRAARAVGAAQGLVAEQEAAHAVALVEERARIARELHDVIAHSVSVMGVQAGAARTLLDTEAEAARTALRSVEATARSAVGELRRLLAVLREDAPAVPERTPQPGLAQLPALVEQVRAAGLPVELALADLPPLPPGVELAAYRIVQEALTNALRHAHAPTRVSLGAAGTRLHIEVRDHGPGSGGDGTGSTGSTGHGLIGMTERAQLYGGSVRAGDHPDGGFVVAACLATGTDEPT